MVAVDPHVYYNGAKSCSELGNDLAGGLKNTLKPGIQAVEDLTKGMNGTHPAAAGWSKAYQQAAQDLATMIGIYANACVHMADVLNACGYNWDTAEFNAAGGKGTAPGKPALSSGPAVGSGDAIKVPDPTGDDGLGLQVNADAAPTLATQLPGALTAQGVTVPNGNTDKLDSAAKAWSTFSTAPAVTGGSDKIGQVMAAFAAVDAPEKDDIVSSLKTLQTTAQTIVTASAGLAAAVKANHDELTSLRTSLCSEIPAALPDKDLMASGVSQPWCVLLDATEMTKKPTADEVNSAAADLAGVVRPSPLFALWASKIAGCDNLDNITDLNEIVGLPVPQESGKSADNLTFKNAVDAITVKSVQDGVNDKGEKTKTITMVDGSKTVLTQTTMTDPDGGPNAKPQPTVKYESYDKNGHLVSTTEFYKNADGAQCTLTTATDSKTGKPITIQQVGPSSGKDGYTTVTSPDGHSATGPYDWFSHPVLDGVGGGASGAETVSDMALENLPETNLITEGAKSLDNIHAGARFLGPAATIVGSALDVANGNSSLSDAIGSTAFQLDGGTLGTASAVAAGRAVGTMLGAADPIPGVDFVTAGLGGILGGEAGGWIYNELK